MVVGITKLNLFDAFDIPYDDLPDIVDTENCIYKITNLVNNKSYIGMTKYLYGRIKGNNWSHYNQYLDAKNGVGGYSIHKDIAFYGPDKFEVSVLEYNIDNLKEREIYWINHFNTFGNGYNLTTGGDNCEQIQSDEVQEIARINSRKTKLITFINSKFELLKENNLEINYYNYRMFCNFGKNFFIHISRVLDLINELRSDERWTNEMESIFSIYSNWNIPNQKAINRIVSGIESRLYIIDKKDFTIKDYLLVNHHNNHIFAYNSSHISYILEYYDDLINDYRVPKHLLSILSPFRNKSQEELIEELNKIYYS